MVPSTPKGEASRARILQTAATVFAAKGYPAATFQDLIAASGMTKGAFYFPAIDKGRPSVISGRQNALMAKAGRLATRRSVINATRRMIRPRR
jgi:hypothetical protein